MTSTDILIGSVRTILNDNTKLFDCFNGTRIGSFFYGPNDKLIYTKYMPKGYITSSDREEEDKSFGDNYESTDIKTVEITFFTKNGDVGSIINKKNNELVMHYENLIRQTLKQNKISGFTLVGFGRVEGPPLYDPDNDLYMTLIPVTYKERIV